MALYVHWLRYSMSAFAPKAAIGPRKQRSPDYVPESLRPKRCPYHLIVDARRDTVHGSEASMVLKGAPWRVVYLQGLSGCLTVLGAAQRSRFRSARTARRFCAGWMARADPVQQMLLVYL